MQVSCRKSLVICNSCGLTAANPLGKKEYLAPRYRYPSAYIGESQKPASPATANAHSVLSSYFTCMVYFDVRPYVYPLFMCMYYAYAYARAHARAHAYAYAYAYMRMYM